MRICILGDSVTYGGYVHNNWVNLLRWHLEKNASKDYEVFNLGINGNTSHDILQRIQVELAARNPDLVVLACGVNDSCTVKNIPTVTEQEFAANVKKISKCARSFTDDVMFVGLVLGDDSLLKPYPESTSGKCYDRERVRRYDQIIQKLTAESGNKYVHLFDKLEFKDFVDGLHPNEAGHQKMFVEIISSFKYLLK